MFTDSNITKHLVDRFFVASYLAVMEKMYGMPGLAAGRDLIREVRADGESALERYICACDTKSEGTPDKDYVAALTAVTGEFMLTDDEDDIDDPDGVPCPVLCAAKAQACEAACDALPDWKLRLLCKAGCTLKFLACLANC
ncbi:hypothetical protein GCM10007094_44460 [Pseudovibrio japonicus]|uniref:Uncharacterized protein n=1 Tax=Pseudovibrio japonicus TaxID=366534 RepID=A0ABQ3EPP8_9HYPH|nr:hypothetical protein [Pseudovibrio japonicus]GHB50294.1 hypothetical protein GCM10007094_44460 [Pseudovibrio japonicus]